MKRIYFLLLITLTCKVVSAQQLPHYTQYILNNYILNPALSGIENYYDVKMSGRSQWVGIEGAPKTFYLSVQGPLGKKDYKTSATSFAVPGENPRGTAYWETYEASEAHHGLGFIVKNDQTGNFNRFSLSASYAYHMGLNPTTNLAAGFAAGFNSFSRNGAKTDFGTGISDPAQDNTLGNRIQPDLSAGVWLYGANYFAGASAQQIIPQKIAYSNGTEGGRLLPHFFATTGYRFLVSEDINALPSVMFKYIPGSASLTQFDLNVKFQYRDLLWAGTSYRYQDGFAAMAGVNLVNTVNIGYAYDYSTTRLQTASGGTHELIIGFTLGNRYGDTCPRNVW